MKGLINVSRSGYIWDLERTTGKINFVAGQPYVRQDVFKSLDPKTGRPDIDESRKPGTDKTAEFCPQLVGRQGLAAGRLQPEHPADVHPGERKPVHRAARRNPEVRRRRALHGRRPQCDEDGRRRDHIGELQAWNVDTGKKVWTTNLPSFNWGPVLATGGDVLFAGGTNDRMFRAFDAKTGKILWEFPTNFGSCGGSGVVRRSTASSTSRFNPAGASIRRRCNRV